MNKSESKYQHTALLMDTALLDLLEKKELAYISVKEICAKAGVNRSTFYLHYETIDDLLEETAEYIQRKFLSSFDRVPEDFIRRIGNAPLEELVLINELFLKPYLDFIFHHRNIFKAAYNNPGCMKAGLYYEDLKKYVLHPIMERFRIPREEQRYWSCYYISGVMAIIWEWLRRDCAEPAQQIQKIIMDCVRPEKPFLDRRPGEKDEGTV